MARHFEPCLPPPGTADGTTHILVCDGVRIALRWWTGGPLFDDHWGAGWGDGWTPATLGARGWRYAERFPSSGEVDSLLGRLRKQLVEYCAELNDAARHNDQLRDCLVAMLDAATPRAAALAAARAQSALSRHAIWKSATVGSRDPWPFGSSAPQEALQ